MINVNKMNDSHTLTKFLVLITLLACTFVLLSIRWQNQKTASQNAPKQSTDSHELKNADIVEFDTSEQAEAFMSSDTQRGLLLIYTNWCGHCKNMMPAYLEAARELKAEGIVIARVEAPKAGSEFMKKYKITGFPTILVGGKNKKEFDGERSTESIVRFARSL